MQAINCAHLFIRNRDAAAIAETLSVSVRTVYRMVKSDAFHAELDARDYTGPRTFRKPHRHSQKHDNARAMWDALKKEGIPRRKRVTRIAQELDAHPVLVRRWLAKWKREGMPDD